MAKREGERSMTDNLATFYAYPRTDTGAWPARRTVTLMFHDWATQGAKPKGRK